MFFATTSGPCTESFLPFLNLLDILTVENVYHLHALLLDYSNQGHLTKFSTNLMRKIVNVYSSFPTHYPCNQAVHHKDNRFLVILDNVLENHCKLQRFLFVKFVENFVGWPWLK